MKKLPEVNVSFEDLYRMLIAPIKSKLLLTGIELKVFDQLSEQRSAEAVAEALGTHPENTRLFLDGLAASNLLEKNDGLCQNIAVTQTFLAKGSPMFMGQMFSFSAQMWDAGLNNLPKQVKEGPSPPSPETDMSDEEMRGQFALLMANNERSGPAQQVAEIVSRPPEFPSFKK
ncbi:hypothetical protein C4E24_05245 [ANME-1 cluster archaeon AG-394-G21]|nr:hypothetical protein [ANME-1 cluster archaeon AG-394-G21]